MKNNEIEMAKSMLKYAFSNLRITEKAYGTNRKEIAYKWDSIKVTLKNCFFECCGEKCVCAGNVARCLVYIGELSEEIRRINL